jgi:hypothetical protein
VKPFNIYVFLTKSSLQLPTQKREKSLQSFCRF